jgi:hypothetical protein
MKIIRDFISAPASTMTFTELQQKHFPHRTAAAIYLKAWNLKKQAKTNGRGSMPPLGAPWATGRKKAVYKADSEDLFTLADDDESSESRSPPQGSEDLHKDRIMVCEALHGRSAKKRAMERLHGFVRANVIRQMRVLLSFISYREAKSLQNSLQRTTLWEFDECPASMNYLPAPSSCQGSQNTQINKEDLQREYEQMQRLAEKRYAIRRTRAKSVPWWVSEGFDPYADEKHHCENVSNNDGDDSRDDLELTWLQWHPAEVRNAKRNDPVSFGSSLPCSPSSSPASRVLKFSVSPMQTNS